MHLVLCDLCLESKKAIIGNSILQKANQYLFFPENLLGIPIDRSASSQRSRHTRVALP